jgi:WD40 repeat protein
MTTVADLPPLPAGADLWDLPPVPMPPGSPAVPFITVEDPPEPSSNSNPIANANSCAVVPRPPQSASYAALRSQSRRSTEGPMSVALDGPNPSPHFVSLENIARLYIELKNDRDHLVQESSKIFAERVAVVRDLRELEAHLNELIQQKALLEDSLDQLGLRDEENRTHLAVVDDKVASIASESQRFEAIVRDLKGTSSASTAAQARAAPASLHGTRRQHRAADNHALPPAPLLQQPPSAACKRTLYGHTGNVLGLDVCRVTNVLVSASSDRSLRTWDTSTGRRLDTLYGHEGWVHAVAFSSAGQRAVSGSAGVTCVQLDDDDILVSGSLDKTLRRYDLGEGRSSSSSADGGSSEGTVIQGHEQGVYCLQFVRHGLASGGGDSLIRMHDMRTGLCHRTLAGHTGGAVRALQFNDVQLVSGGADMMLRFWDLRTGGCTGTVEAGARINAIHVSGGRVTAACGDHTLKVYDAQSKRLLTEHGGHLGPVLSLAGYGASYFTGSTDQTTKLWILPELAGESSLDSGELSSPI